MRMDDINAQDAGAFGFRASEDFTVTEFGCHKLEHPIEVKKGRLYYVEYAAFTIRDCTDDPDFFMKRGN